MNANAISLQVSGYIRAIFLVMILVSFLSVTIMAADAVAQNADSSEEGKKTRRTPTLDERTYKQFSNIQEMMEEKNIVEAREALLKIASRRNSNFYVKATVYNMLALLAYNEEDYDGAIEYYEKIIAQPEEIPESLEQSTLYSLGQLHYVQGDHEQAIEYLTRWFDLVPPQGPRPYVFLAQAYYQVKQYDNAIVAIHSAMDAARSQDLPIREQWWLLLRSMYYEREEFDEVIRILRILIRDFPKKEYWIQLSGFYAQEGKDLQQIQSIDAAYIGGYLDRESEFLNLAGLLMQNDFPYRAARILAEAMEEGHVESNGDNLEMLAQAWQLAHESEKAIEALQEAAKTSKKGEIYTRLAQIYFATDRFNECFDASRSAMEVGNLKNEDLVHEIQGMCVFNLKKLEQAQAIFRKIRKTLNKRYAKGDKQRISQEDRLRTTRINNWIKHIGSEIRRRDALAELKQG